MAFEVLIRESHMDSLGHMNNAAYLELYEAARWELITYHGYGYKEVQERQQGPVILDLSVKFLKEICLREKISITTELIKYDGKIGQLKQTMLKDNGDIASVALFTFGLFDMKLRKLIEPTEAWKLALGAN